MPDQNARTKEARNAAAQWLAELKELPVLVAGDLMVDRYVTGDARRISPEAPVPVLEARGCEDRAGGAANVAANLRALGLKPYLCGTVGADEPGRWLRRALESGGIDASAFVETPGKRTTRKTRVLSGQQHLLRIDEEDARPVGAAVTAELQRQLRRLLDEAGLRAIVVEDYNKGLLSAELIAWLLREACEREIPVLVDPKFDNFFAYRDCAVFKPNLKELARGLGRELDGDNIPQLKEAAAQLRARMPHKHTLITLGPNGALAVDEAGAAVHIRAHLRQIADVSGAGDTVVGVLAAAFAAGVDFLQAARLANLAGGMVCEQVGVVTLDPDGFLEEISRKGLSPRPAL